MSFLTDFDTIVSETECPRSYGIYSGLITLSSIISRRVWLPMGHYNIFPNLYVVFVGPPGFRKSTGMDIGKGLIRRINKSRPQNDADAALGIKTDIPISAECVTAEKLIQDMETTKRTLAGLDPKWVEAGMGTYSPMTVMVTELSELLKVGGPAMISFLTAIYDRDIYDYRTKNRGQQYVEGPFLNVAACTTPDWINTYLRDDVISGGFSRRGLFVYETNEGRRIAIPKVSDESKRAYNRMMEYAQRVDQIKGPMTLTPEAEKRYVDWYNTYTIPKDPNVAGYYRSKHVQMFKLAILLSLADSPNRIITVDHINSAFDLLALMEVNLSAVFAGMGKNELHQVAHQVLTFLDSTPAKDYQIGNQTIKLQAVMERQLRVMMFQSSNRAGIDEVITHLAETNRIKRFEIRQGSFVNILIALNPDYHK